MPSLGWRMRLHNSEALSDQHAIGAASQQKLAQNSLGTMTAKAMPFSCHSDQGTIVALHDSPSVSDR